MITANKIIIFNCPAGSGKDTIGRCFKNLFGCELRAFKTALYLATFPHTSCKNYAEFIKYCTDRELKEIPNFKFDGLSPRQMLIRVSENIIKPKYGKAYFGLKSAEEISPQSFSKGVVFTDGGFPEEVVPLIEKFGKHSIYVIQFCGQGKNDFEGDSRDFFNLPDVKTIRMTQENEEIIPESFARLVAKEIELYDGN